jgi:hypothetical protein
MTYEAFKKLPYDSVFATGLVPNMPGGLFMERDNEGRLLRWVAKKGKIDDWAVYVHWATKSVEEVRDYGDKIHGKDLITDLVPCDEPMLNMYRR